jgi:hypothetical protein
MYFDLKEERGFLIPLNRGKSSVKSDSEASLCKLTEAQLKVSSENLMIVGSQI